ncbi:auxin-responsive protein SAUR78-like [Nymphaea colorata]|nr:auxin-responsive protein SAUR78-like [Nymphaea colorata]
MAKGGTIWKLKFMIKKWRGLSKIGRSKSSSSVDSKLPPSDDGWCLDADTGEVPVGYQAVYVGKSRRRYVIRSDHVNHPLVRELVDKSEGSDTVVVGCEVVLFEHLLWMLENADPQQESIDELVGFYAC